MDKFRNQFAYLTAIITIMLSFWDLKDEFVLMLEHFTLMSLLFALRDHPISLTLFIISIIFVFGKAFSSIKKKRHL